MIKINYRTIVENAVLGEEKETKKHEFSKDHKDYHHVMIGGRGAHHQASLIKKAKAHGGDNEGVSHRGGHHFIVHKDHLEKFKKHLDDKKVDHKVEPAEKDDHLG